MDVTAHLRNLRMSPRKVRLVADLVRGLPVGEADAQLAYLSRAAALPLRKLLASAVANAEHNAKLSRANLYVGQIAVNQGPTLKRFRPRAFGRAAAIRKRSCHVHVVLMERVPTTVGRAPGAPATGAAPPPVTVAERPRIPRREDRAPTSEPEIRDSNAEIPSKELFDVHRKGKHREEKEHELRKDRKQPGGFFKRLVTRRFGEK